MFQGHERHLKEAKVHEHGRRTADVAMKSEGVESQNTRFQGEIGDRIAAEVNLYP